MRSLLPPLQKQSVACIPKRYTSVLVPITKVASPSVRAIIDPVVNIAATVGRELGQNKKIYDVDRVNHFVNVTAPVIGSKSQGANIAKVEAPALELLPSDMAAAAVGYAAPASTIPYVMRSKAEVPRRRFMAYVLGTGGKAIEETVPYELRQMAKVVSKADSMAAPFTERYGTVAPSENPLSYALMYKFLPDRIRKKVLTALGLGGASTAIAMGAGMAADAMNQNK